MASDQDDAGFLPTLVQSMVTGALLGTAMGASIVYWHSYEQNPLAQFQATKPGERPRRAPFSFQGLSRSVRPVDFTSATSAQGGAPVHPALQSPWRTVAAHAGFLSSIGGLFVVGEYSARALRGDKQDPWNSAIGGCLAGSAFGVRAGSLGTGVGICAVLGAFGAFLDWSFSKSSEPALNPPQPGVRHCVELAEQADEAAESAR
ncbi:hypothetical protein CYME_CMA128C [Cyanidioschyzon merolae strain 10D]|jgi:hypothetical protein|uniref:Uncharacterized protein n=1 Tax=Cyanidioschyzon merolae (strain NIES-3377 / 10D) TaxID=280699 RepID=M1VEB9_CYAM1|nr:hypothetical protein CYME_CMA128C [Cyanidioschyzon merolae strain 10D]BAM78818.1 hypothetical protein CYME_CMA128C [Cyanidioschyzon merolae strain 10D]|eukprot:XP_005535104.1 hypothetical protein CYME_CMA128C [Cyanidioschyzon merolae strain 10D]